tara:strand:+ start:99 stop:1205 length:1107 start_codon:yes stop_codon:yes gene_type:complete
MKECNNCLLNDSIDTVTLDKENVCNFCREFKKYRYFFDKSEIYTSYKLKKISREIRSKTKGEKYNCLIGISGGIDSSYLVYLAKKMNLRTLLVHFDNGWNSVTAIKNIFKLSKYTGFKLKTYVIDWEEFKSLQRSFIKSGVIDVEMLTDHAIGATLIKIAKEENIKFVLSGENFSTENGMPAAWTWQKIDKKNIESINKNYENIKINKFPIINYFNYLKTLFFSKIKFVKVLNEIHYEKYKSIEILKEKVGFLEYENKHDESLFTKFYQTYYLPKRFGIDKRMAHLSALIRNEEITKEAGKKILDKKLETNEFKTEKKFVCEKLGFTLDQMENLVNQPIRAHSDFGSDIRYLTFIFKIKNILGIKLFK